MSATHLISNLKNEKHLEHQTIKVGGKLYNLQNSQLQKHNESNFVG